MFGFSGSRGHTAGIDQKVFTSLSSTKPNKLAYEQEKSIERVHQWIHQQHRFAGVPPPEEEPALFRSQSTADIKERSSISDSSDWLPTCRSEEQILSAHTNQGDIFKFSGLELNKYYSPNLPRRRRYIPHSDPSINTAQQGVHSRINFDQFRNGGEMKRQLMKHSSFARNFYRKGEGNTFPRRRKLNDHKRSLFASPVIHQKDDDLVSSTSRGEQALPKSCRSTNQSNSEYADRATEGQHSSVCREKPSVLNGKEHLRISQETSAEKNSDLLDSAESQHVSSTNLPDVALLAAKVIQKRDSSDSISKDKPKKTPPYGHLRMGSAPEVCAMDQSKSLNGYSSCRRDVRKVKASSWPKRAVLPSYKEFMSFTKNTTPNKTESGYNTEKSEDKIDTVIVDNDKFNRCIDLNSSSDKSADSNPPPARPPPPSSRSYCDASTSQGHTSEEISCDMDRFPDIITETNLIASHGRNSGLDYSRCNNPSGDTFKSELPKNDCILSPAESMRDLSCNNDSTPSGISSPTELTRNITRSKDCNLSRYSSSSDLARNVGLFNNCRRSAFSSPTNLTGKVTRSNGCSPSVLSSSSDPTKDTNRVNDCTPSGFSSPTAFKRKNTSSNDFKQSAFSSSTNLNRKVNRSNGCPTSVFSSSTDLTRNVNRIIDCTPPGFSSSADLTRKVSMSLRDLIRIHEQEIARVSGGGSVHLRSVEALHEKVYKSSSVDCKGGNQSMWKRHTTIGLLSHFNDMEKEFDGKDCDQPVLSPTCLKSDCTYAHFNTQKFESSHPDIIPSPCSPTGEKPGKRRNRPVTLPKPKTSRASLNSLFAETPASAAGRIENSVKRDVPVSKSADGPSLVKVNAYVQTDMVLLTSRGNNNNTNNDTVDINNNNNNNDFFSLSNDKDFATEKEEMRKKFEKEKEIMNKKLDEQKKVANAYQKLEDRYRRKVYELQKALNACTCLRGNIVKKKNTSNAKDSSIQPNLASISHGNDISLQKVDGILFQLEAWLNNQTNGIQTDINDFSSFLTNEDVYPRYRHSSEHFASPPLEIIDRIDATSV